MNKTLKKTLSIILAVLMIVATVPFAFAAGDGTPLTIDVTDKSMVEIGNGYDYYDEDGYILTGSSDARVDIFESSDLTLKNAVFSQLITQYAPEGSVFDITLEGANEVTGFIGFMKEHLIFNGSEDATLKTPYIYTNGENGTATVNGGNIILTDKEVPIGCGDFIINGGTVTASSDRSYVMWSDATLNGGVLNLESTAADYEAICGTVTMKKGALLTVSAQSEMFYSDSNIVLADDDAENDYFFVRYDKESEFAPVSDIKAALDGKTYAEIKVDTHEHDFDNSGKCICGYECPHENQTGETCAVCGATLHTCDFSGEWKNDSEKHWKECTCGLTGEEGKHSWIFGECTECGYACEHSFTDYTETKAPTCTEKGEEVAGCDNDCGAMNPEKIPALGHSDDNGDNLCDNGCGSELVVIDGETYAVLGDVTYTGVAYDYTEVHTLEPGCYKAGDGYVIVKYTGERTELILYNATIDVREEAVSDDSSENYAVCVYGDLNVTFIGTNNIYAKEGYDAFRNTSSSNEDAQLVISGAEGAVLNLYGCLYGYYITVKSGTVNVYEDDPDIIFAINADKYFTVEKDAIVTAVGADNEIFPNIGVLSQRGMTVEGVLNTFTFELPGENENLFVLKVFGDVSAHQDIDLSLAAQEGAAIDLVIPEGASLTIPEGYTINLDSFNNVDITGELIVNGTLICTHKDGEATCTEKAVCDVCGREYGDIDEDNHKDTLIQVGAQAKTCTEIGWDAYEYCTACDYTTYKEIPSNGHTPLDAVKENEVAPKCGVAGSYDLVVYCDVCGEELDRDTTTVDALAHTDADGDYLCDNGCGHEFEKPAEPTPDTPDEPTDEPTDDNCDHLCHKSGFMGLIWKIVRFFQKLFKMNPVCECGAAHY